MRPKRVRQSWWRRERIAIVLLPVVLVAAVAATSSRVDEYWWQKGFHEQAPRDDRGVVSVDVDFDDGFLKYPIRADISLVSAERVTEVPGAYQAMRLPTGASLWEVRLRWKADPDVSLTGCSIALVDDDGNRYDIDPTSFDPGAVTSVQTCVPDDAPGPQPQPLSAEPPTNPPGAAERPASYETRAYIVVPEDVEPTAVRVWWLLPTYAELPLD